MIITQLTIESAFLFWCAVWSTVLSSLLLFFYPENSIVYVVVTVSVIAWVAFGIAFIINLFENKNTKSHNGNEVSKGDKA